MAFLTKGFKSTTNRPAPKTQSRGGGVVGGRLTAKPRGCATCGGGRSRGR